LVDIRLEEVELITLCGAMEYSSAMWESKSNYDGSGRLMEMVRLDIACTSSSAHLQARSTLPRRLKKDLARQSVIRRRG
jgi:hypothetical protein